VITPNLGVRPDRALFGTARLRRVAEAFGGLRELVGDLTAARAYRCVVGDSIAGIYARSHQ